MPPLKCNIRSCDLDVTDIIDVKTLVGFFSFGLCQIHYQIFTEGEILGRDLNPKKKSLSNIAKDGYFESVKKYS